MDNFIASFMKHSHSSLDGNFGRPRHSDACLLWRVRKILWSCLVSSFYYTGRYYSETSLQWNRLAPVKKITLPRLELLAELVLQCFCRETGLLIRNAKLWTDAMVVLSWIRSNPGRWKIFVCNRVTGIQAYTTPTQWKYKPRRRQSSRFSV